MDYIESDSDDSMDSSVQLPKNSFDEKKITLSQKLSLRILENDTKLDLLKSSNVAK